MPLASELIDPVRLVDTARRVFEATNRSDLLLSQVLPVDEDNDTVVEWTNDGTSRIQAATFRSYDAESEIGGTAGVQQSRLTLPPVSRKNSIGEYEQIRFRADASQRLEDKLLKSAGVLAAGVAGRLELARSEALYSGQIALNENGVVFTVNYSRTGSHNVSGSKWSTANTATPIKDLLDAAELINDAGGDPTDIFMNQATFNLMRKTNEMRDLVTVGGTTPPLIPNNVVAATLESFGLPPITIVNKAIDVGASKTKVIGDNKVIVVDRNGIGVTKVGRTLLQDQVPDTEPMGPGVMAHHWVISPDPVQLWVKAEAYALPIMQNPDFSAGIDVS